MTQSPYNRLEELLDYIKLQISLEEYPPTYNGTQRVIAYTRVLNRLRPIVLQARRVRATFHFDDAVPSVDQNEKL